MILTLYDNIIIEYKDVVFLTIQGVFMKNLKMLFLSALAIVASISAVDLQQLTEKDVAAMQKAEQSLYNVINNCDKADGNHQLRMNDLRDNTWDLSVSRFNHILRLQFEQDVSVDVEEILDDVFVARFAQLYGKYNKSHYLCNDCREIAAFVVGANFDFSKAEKEGKGDMLVIDFVEEKNKTRAGR